MARRKHSYPAPVSSSDSISRTRPLRFSLRLPLPIWCVRGRNSVSVMRYVVTLLSILMLCGFRPAARGQASAGSDVLILVQPMGNSSLLAVTFAKATPHSRARTLLGDLAHRGGWKLGPVETKD